MEVGMCVRSLVRLPPSNSGRIQEDGPFLLTGWSRSSSSSSSSRSIDEGRKKWRQLVVVAAKKRRGGGGQMSRPFERAPPPPLPKIEDDGNPRFVIFIRTARVYLWYPLSLISGGTTAKIMVAAKDNFLGKYIYKDTIARNLAAVIYRDEKEIQKTAVQRFRVLRSATEFRYGYKLVENNNLKAALSTSDVIELPPKEELKTVLDKVKDFFGDAASNAKESFGKLTDLSSVDSGET